MNMPSTHKKLKIAIIDMDDLKSPFWAAGQARATREVAKRLALKHSVTVFTSKYPHFQDYKEDGILYKHVGITINQPQIANALFLATIPFVVKQIKNADVIIENFNAPTSVSFAPLFTKIPVIGLPTMFNAIEFYKKYHLPFHWVERFGSKFYKYFLPYSDVDSGKMLSYNPKVMYKIVPQGVGNEFFKIKHKKPTHILFLGRFDIAQKGIDLLIEAYAKVADKMSLPLVIAGHGSDEEKIREQIKKLKLEKKIKIVGSAYGKKKVELIESAAFVAFPSRHDELSLWALEALASGMPLVMFDLPECRWADSSIAMKAKPFDVNAYSKLLLKMVDTTINKKMRINARNFAKKYTWEKVAADFEDFILDVLKKEKNEKSN